MLPFLQKTTQYLVANFPGDLSDICIVLPNRRGGLFLRRYLAAEAGKTIWSPAIFSIEDFVAEISGLQEVENIHLLFELFQVHLEKEGKNAQTFEEFLKWAPQLLSDFNEIDRYLADPKELFSSLTEARAISLWNLDGQPLTEFERKYLSFYQSLIYYYQKLTERLLAKNQAYQGLNFRVVAGQIDAKLADLPWRHVVFCGFNALIKAEEVIINALKKEGRATLLWDADHYYIDAPQQEAGDFLRDLMRKWPVKEPAWIFDHFATGEKQIEIIGSPDPVGQVKYCGRLLQELATINQANEKTAVVLLDEGLLIPLLNSIPEQVESLNITAGLSLSQTPLANLFEMVFRMHLNASRFKNISSKGKERYYYKDVLKVLQHPYIQRIAQVSANGEHVLLNQAMDKIRLGQQLFAGFRDIVSNEPDLYTAGLLFLEELFFTWSKPADTMTCFKKLIEHLRQSEVKSLEQEYLFAFSRLIYQLSNLLTLFPSELSIQAFYEMYDQTISSTSLPFYGEPLKGVQLMGMLETRTLDFDNVIMLSCNEGLLPSAKVNTSFIPFDIKRIFGLPTYRHKDSVYAYHFYRLLQRAGKVWILYSTEPDQLGGGDRSRFLRQIAAELPSYNSKITINHSVLATAIPAGEPAPEITIEKTDEVLSLLEKKAEKGLSATSLNAYRNCPLKFYYSEVAGIKEPEDVDDTIDPAVLGTAVHEALNRLYKPYLGQPLMKSFFEAMEKKSDEIVDLAFRDKFKGSDIMFGKNCLLVSVAKLMVKRFLRYESKEIGEIVTSGETRMVTHLEKFIETTIMIQYREKDFNVKLKGYIDRVDIMGGEWKIIDYKTGTTEQKQVSIKDWEDLITNADLNIGFQLMMYAYLLSCREGKNKNYTAGIISLKKINSGYIPVTVPSEPSGSSNALLDETILNQFEWIVKAILAEMFDPDQPFTQTDDLNICQRCPYINLCLR